MIFKRIIFIVLATHLSMQAMEEVKVAEGYDALGSFIGSVDLQIIKAESETDYIQAWQLEEQQKEMTALAGLCFDVWAMMHADESILGMITDADMKNGQSFFQGRLRAVSALDLHGYELNHREKSLTALAYLKEQHIKLLMFINESILALRDRNLKGFLNILNKKRGESLAKKRRQQAIDDQRLIENLDKIPLNARLFWK